MQGFVGREELITDAIFCALGSLFYVANTAQNWRRFKLQPGPTQSWYHDKHYLSAVALATLFLFGNMACSLWIGIAHISGLPDAVPGIIWQATIAVCFAGSELTILYAVSDRMPRRQLGGLCIALLLGLWVAFGIWQWSSGAVWAFPAMIHGAFAAILLYHISSRQSIASHPAPPRSDFIRLFLRTLITTTSLGMGFYSFVKGPLRCHFGVQCAFSLFEIVQSAICAGKRFIEDRSDRRRTEDISNRRRSMSWVDGQSQQSLVHRDGAVIFV